MLLAVNDDYKKTILEGYKTIIAEQARCSEVRVRRSGASFSGEFVLSKTAMAMAGDVEVMVPLEGLVDPKAELDKLQKDKLKLEKDIAYYKRKLADTNYTSRAPLEVLDKDKAKLAEAEAALAKLEIAHRPPQVAERPPRHCRRSGGSGRVAGRRAASSAAGRRRARPSPSPPRSRVLFLARRLLGRRGRRRARRSPVGASASWFFITGIGGGGGAARSTSSGTYFLAANATAPTPRRSASATKVTLRRARQRIHCRRARSARNTPSIRICVSSLCRTVCVCSIGRQRASGRRDRDGLFQVLLVVARVDDHQRARRPAM